MKSLIVTLETSPINREGAIKTEGLTMMIVAVVVKTLVFLLVFIALILLGDHFHGAWKRWTGKMRERGVLNKCSPADLGEIVEGKYPVPEAKWAAARDLLAEAQGVKLPPRKLTILLCRLSVKLPALLMNGLRWLWRMLRVMISALIWPWRLVRASIRRLSRLLPGSWRRKPHRQKSFQEGS